MNNKTFDNELKFRLFPNEKGDNAKRPDYRGEAQIGGVAYRMSAWVAEAQSGMKYLRGVIERKPDGPQDYPKQGAAAPQPKVHVSGPANTEDVPF